MLKLLNLFGLDEYSIYILYIKYIWLSIWITDEMLLTVKIMYIEICINSFEPYKRNQNEEKS